MKITMYDDKTHRDQVIKLWTETFGYTDRRNRPDKVIDRKIEFEKDLFFVALDGSAVSGTVMAGYDGHRGWIYSLAVRPDKRHCKTGSNLLNHAEERLIELGCCKINLQVLSSNSGVIDFYKKQGYHIEERISMGKEIPENIQ